MVLNVLVTHERECRCPWEIHDEVSRDGEALCLQPLSNGSKTMMDRNVYTHRLRKKERRQGEKEKGGGDENVKSWDM